MERTADFLSAVDQFRADPKVLQAQRDVVAAAAASKKTKAGGDGTEFNGIASAISKDINVTCAKLGKLNGLVQRKTLFNDPTQQINDLVASVKGDIAKLNQNLGDTEQLVRSKNSGYGSKKQQTTHSQGVVNQLRIQLAHATTQFKNVLEARQASMKAQQQRKGKFGTRDGGSGRALLYHPAVPVISQAGAGGSEKDSLLEVDISSAMPRPSGGQLAPNSKPNTPTAGPMTLSPMQQQQLIPDQSYLQDRANAVGDIETHIAELGSVFNKLGNLIAEQEDMVQRIDDNVDNSVQNVTNAQNELQKYWKSISGNRMLMAKIFGILMFFITMMVLMM